jgi:ribosomal protein S18 acetylase RimI-like enzyme
MDASNTRAASRLQLRDAQPGELETVSSLLAEVYGEFRPHFPTEAWELYLGEIVDVRSRLADSELIVAEDEGRLIGTVGFYPDASRSALERWPAGWASIRALAVLTAARGQGVGEALARECLLRTRQRGARAVGLHTNPFMEAATRLYERLGFRRAPEFDIEIGEMFTGRSLPPDVGWQARAFRLDLEEGRR